MIVSFTYLFICLFRDACYLLSDVYVTAAEAAVMCGMINGSRLASVIQLEELNELRLILPAGMKHWVGMYKGSTSSDPMVLSDGQRELYESTFASQLESSSSLSSAICPDCKCIYMGGDFKLSSAKCSEIRPFLCEMKG